MGGVGQVQGVLHVLVLLVVTVLPVIILLSLVLILPVMKGPSLEYVPVTNPHLGVPWPWWTRSGSPTTSSPGSTCWAGGWTVRQLLRSGATVQILPSCDNIGF